MSDIGLKRLGELLRARCSEGDGEVIHLIEHVAREFSEARQWDGHREASRESDARLRQVRDLRADERVVVLTCAPAGPRLGSVVRLHGRNHANASCPGITAESIPAYEEVPSSSSSFSGGACRHRMWQHHAQGERRSPTVFGRRTPTSLWRFGGSHHDRGPDHHR